MKWLIIFLIFLWWCIWENEHKDIEEKLEKLLKNKL